MIDKELRELRRRLRPQKNNITKIHGCYVTGSGEIITSFTRSVAMMPENEAEKYLAILKRTMTGALGKRLIDICFATSQVAVSPVDFNGNGVDDYADLVLGARQDANTHPRSDGA